MSNSETQGLKIKIGKISKVYFYDTHTALVRRIYNEHTNSSNIDYQSNSNDSSDVQCPINETLIVFLTDSQVIFLSLSPSFIFIANP